MTTNPAARPPARPGGPAPAGTYVKKPLPISAIQWTCDNYGEVAAFHGEDFELIEAPDGSTAIVIHTLEGDMLADCGDWIIRGIVQELYPCKPGVFSASYDFKEDQPA